MITDETHPRMQQATRNLESILRSVVLGRILNERTIHILNQVVKEHRSNQRLRGVDFPKLTVMFLPSKGRLKLLRADLDENGIREAVLSTVAEFPDIDLRELAESIHFAWPGLKRIALFDEAEHIGRKLEQTV